ncbi:MAG: outer membrane beta-barrel protein, partial [Flavobacteriaceae bacterium]
AQSDSTNCSTTSKDSFRLMCFVGFTFLSKLCLQRALNEKASISLNITDLLNTQRRNLESTTPTFYSNGYYRWRVRSFSLSFTYRFNQRKKRPEQGQYGSNFSG